MNDEIRISPVRLIDPDGEQVGVVSLQAAREAAAEHDLDLVEVAPNARPPVLKVMDWGKYRYEQQKQQQEARRNQQTVETKEVQLRPVTEDHDFNTKIKRARRFLEDGNVVRIVLRYRGREMRRPEVGEAMLDRVADATSDLAEVEHRSRKIEGRRLLMRLEPTAN
ncbi:MAG: translation initiation factor IF-3 [Gemmatimonadota bacterium]